MARINTSEAEVRVDFDGLCAGLGLDLDMDNPPFGMAAAITPKG